MWSILKLNIHVLQHHYYFIGEHLGKIEIVDENQELPDRSLTPRETTFVGNKTPEKAHKTALSKKKTNKTPVSKKKTLKKGSPGGRVQKRRNSVPKKKTSLMGLLTPFVGPQEEVDDSIMNDETADKKRKHSESESPKKPSPFEPGEAWDHESGEVEFGN